MLCARETPSRVHARVTTRESSTGPPVSVTQLDWFGVHVFFGRPFLYHFLSPLAVADLRRAAGAVHPWRWPPPVATRYLLSRLWVHCGAERRNLGGWRGRLRGGTVGGHPGQDVEGRPTPAVPSPSVSSGNTWICRVTRSRQEEGGELGDGIGELVVDGPWTCGAQARRRPRGARAERVLPTAWRANGAWLMTDWNDGAMTMRPPWALKGQGCADRGEHQ